MNKIWGATALMAAVSIGALSAAHAQDGPVGGVKATGASISALSSKTSVSTTAAASEPVTFEVFLPLRNEAGLDTLIAQQQDVNSPNYHKWLTPTQFGAQFGPTAASMARVKAALTQAGFTVNTVHTHSINVTGTVGTVNQAFSVALKAVVRRDGSRHLVAAKSLSLSAPLSAEGVTIVKFTGLPPKQTGAKVATTSVPDNRYSNVGGYWFTDLRQAYGFPAYDAKTSAGQTLDGTGVNVAVLMSSDALDSDVAAQFNHEQFSTITGKPAPKINHLAINGGGGVDGDAFYEASLDVQEVLGGAPGANVTLVNIPSLNDSDIISGYLTIVESNAYDVVNSSFGGCELAYTAAYNGGQDYTGILKTYNTLFKQGNAQGITFVASSGDSGGLSCPDVSYFDPNSTAQAKFVPSVEFPSDSPNVTGVGGTNLVTTTPPSPQTSPATLTSKYVAENANGDPEVPYDIYGVGKTVAGGYWGAGGGRSAVFSAPAYQLLTDTGSRRRTVPDVGMQVGGCPGGIAQLPCGPNRSYVIIYANGSRVGLIGTSVSSPEFVGAAALYIQTKGRQGNLNTYLYTKAARQLSGNGSFYHIDIPGFDGKWNSTTPAAGYDYLVGNGTPKVRDLFGFANLPAAGDPQTSSNP